MIIAVAVLFGLARLRFPAAERRSTPTSSGPLERLAARASYDNLAAAVSTVLQRVTPATVLVDLVEEVTADAAVAPTPRGQAAPVPAAPRRGQRALGVLVSSDLAIVRVPAGFRVVVSPEGSGAIQIRGVDQTREIALVQVPSPREFEACPSARAASPGLPTWP